MKDINKDIENLEEIINLINKELDKKDKNVSAILDIEDLISLKHILSDYKRVLKENEQIRTEVNSLKEDNERYQELELQILESEE